MYGINDSIFLFKQGFDIHICILKRYDKFLKIKIIK
jgi:hypothetical protein